MQSMWSYSYNRNQTALIYCILNIKELIKPIWIEQAKVNIFLDILSDFNFLEISFVLILLMY